MTNKEANKIIAEFMELEWDTLPSGDIGVASYTHGIKSILAINPFSSSLDNLELVWEKIETGFLEVSLCGYDSQAEWYREEGNIGYIARAKHYSNSVKQAAAVATAKAILEVGK